MKFTVLTLRPGKTEGAKILRYRDTAGGVSILTLTASEYTALGEPAPGDVFEGEGADALADLAARKDAEARALRYLAAADQSECALHDKLRHAGVSRALAKETTERMVALGYIDEERQALWLVEQLANENLFGKEKIYHKLAAKGYHFAHIRAAVEKLVADGTVDFESNKEKLLEKKLGDNRDPDLVNKILYQNGYRI